MENNERDRKLDQWLDEALSQYSAAEPRLGLEQRVLAHVQAEEKTRNTRLGFWRWMPAFAAIAAVLIVMVAVRPYWENKNSGSSGYLGVQKPLANEEKAQTTDQLQASKSSADEELSKRKAHATPRFEAVAPAKKGGSAKDAATNELRSRNAEASATVLAVTPPVANNFEDDSRAVTKEADVKAFRAGTSAQKNLRSDIALDAPAAAPAPVPPAATSAAVGGVVSRNVVAGAAVPDSRSPSPVQAQTIQVNPPAEVVQAQSGIVSTEKIAAMPPVSAKQMKTMKAKAAGPLAKKLEEKVDTINVVGMPIVRTDLKNVPPGPIQQFPSPLPLSEQEKLMLAAAKQLKNKPADPDKQDTSDGQLKEIEIKKIEIAPLPGPPK